MLAKVFQLNKFYISAIISLLICGLFFSYYNNINVSIAIYKKNMENNSHSVKLLDSEAMTKSGADTNKSKYSNERLAITENEEINSEKKLADSHQGSLERKWMFYYFYIFNILFLSTFILYNKGWFIKVLRSRYQFYQVHYIQLKDGKKNALSYNYSF